MPFEAGEEYQHAGVPASKFGDLFMTTCTKPCGNE
jgi:hypothetical protein